MFKFIVLALLAGVIYFGYTKYMAPPSAAVTAYTQFVTALANGKYDDAKRMSTDAATSAVENTQKEMTGNIGPTGTVYGMALPTTNKAAMMNQIAGRIVNVSFKATAEHREGNCTTLDGAQAVCREQPGCMGARCTHCAQSTHHATVCGSSSADLKVTSYSVTDIAEPVRP